MRISFDKEFWMTIVLCLLATCALTFLLITTTVLAGHDNGDNQCISDEKVLGENETKTFTVDGDDVEVTFKNHDDSKDEVNLDVDSTPVSVPEKDIGDGGTDKGKWNSVSTNSSLEVRIPGATGQGSDITSISVEVHDTDCGDESGGGGGGGSGGACDGNTKKTTSVVDDFDGELGVESYLDCSDAIGLQNCDKTSSNSKSASLDLSKVLDDGQTPGDLTVSFSESSWSEGFTASINCQQNDNYCDAKAEITYPNDPDTSQRSVSTEFNINSQDTDHNADDWIVEDIADSRNEVTLETVASSSIDASGDNDESASADVTVEDIQLQVCEEDNNPPTADNDLASIDLCSAEVINMYVLDNDDDDDGDKLEITNWTEPKDEDGITNGTITKIKTDPPKLSYNPSYGPSTVTFDYTVSDNNGGTDTATTTVEVNGTTGSCQGSITVEVKDTSGNLKSADSIQVEYDGNVKDLGSGSSGSTNVDLKDSGADAVIEKSDIDPPEGYEVRDGDDWVFKNEAVETYSEPYRSELGF